MDDAIAYTVSTSSTLKSPTWTERPDLICDQLIRGTAPTMDRAQFMWRFGTMNSQASDALAYVAPLSIVGKFIHVEAASINIDWVGYVVGETMLRGPQETNSGAQRVAYGDQRFDAYGLEWFLARQTIESSVIYAASNPPRIERAMGYNTGLGEGRSVTYAERKNKDTRGEHFAVDQDHAELWTGDEIARSLLADYPPADKNAVEEPCGFQLAVGAAAFINWFSPTIRTENRSVWQALNDLISPRRGLVWWIEYVVDDEIAYVHISSMAPSSISIPAGGTLPAASTTLALSDDHRFRPQISKDAERGYDVVVFRGARRRSVFTLGYPNGTLIVGWKSAEETEYKAGSSADGDYGSLLESEKKLRNDRLRASHRFRTVYSDFLVPLTWSGKSNDGGSAPGSTAYACPKPPQGSTSFGTGDQEKLNLFGARLQRTLPIYVGWDYTTATAPTTNIATNQAAEFLQPFATIKVDDNKYEMMHQLTGGKASYRLSVLDDSAGIRLEAGGLNHKLAKNHWDGAAPSADDPELDYEQVRATVCAEFDGYCQGQWPADPPTTKPLSTLYLHADDPDRLRFDWLAAGTIYDVQGGALKTVTTGGAIRDDRNLCIALAKTAQQWYATDRATLSVALATLAPLLSLTTLKVGTLITTFGTGAAAATINATVSQLAINLEAGTGNVSCGFEELDVAGLL